MSNILLRSLRKHPWIIAIIGIVVTVQIIELALLIRKYSFFNPAFLQPYSIETLSDRTLFFSASIYGDLFLYSTLALIFFFITSIRNKNHLISAYHFFFSVSTISLAALLAKYKALSYMSDTLNFAIVKDIAGGSILSALSYIADEAVIIVVLLCLAFLTHWIGYRWLSKLNDRQTLIYCQNDTFATKPILIFFTISLIGMITIATLVQQHDNVRFGVIKKNSYGLLISILDTATDLDRDGFGYFSFPADQAILNANIYPGAVDIPDNNIDEDLLLGDFQLPNIKYNLDYSNVSMKYDHVFFIILESAREDLLTKRINNFDVAPNIRQIAKNGTIFPNTYSHTGFTHTSLKAIFNGSLIAANKNDSLFEILKNIGYSINIFSGQAEAFGDISKETNMEKFADILFDAESNIEERVYANTDLGSLRLSEETVMNAVKKQLTNANKDANYFYYINLQAAHFPYHHSKMKNLLDISPIPRNQISQENQEWLEKTYWNAIASADNAVGELVEHLKKLKLYDQSLIIITGDHGESLFDDGVLGHGHRINNQQLKIPFTANIKTHSIKTPIGQTDMREIVLDLINHDQNFSITNSKFKNKDNVFHFVGSLYKPVQISHTYNDDRIIFDFRTRKVMFDSERGWKQINQLRDEKYIKMLKNLIFEWEYLNYKNSQANQQLNE